MSKGFWRSSLGGLALYCGCGVAAIHVPLQLQFHHYDPQTVTLLNSGKYNSITTETNTLLFNRFGRAVEVVQVPFARTEHMMDSGAPVCTTDRVKNKTRAQRYLFSKAVNFFLGYRLYQLTTVPPIATEHLNSKGQIRSIAEVMNALPHAHLLVSEHFSYGEALDQDIRKVAQRQVLPLAASHYSENFLGMFASKRAEFAVLYPTEFKNFMQNHPELQTRSYEIASSPALITGHLMCTDTTQVRKFIQAVDSELTKLYQDKGFIQAHTRYLGKEDAELISALIQQYAN